MTISLSQVLRHGSSKPGGVALAGITLPTEVEIAVDDEPDIALDLVIEATLDGSVGYRYFANRVTATRRTDGPEVTNAALQKLRVQEYIQRGLGQLFDPSPLVVTPEHAAYVRGLGPSSSIALVEVSRVYSYAYAVNLPPAKTVQKVFGMSAPTASNWIRRARDLKFLFSPRPLPSPDLDDVDSSVTEWITTMRTDRA